MVLEADVRRRSWRRQAVAGGGELVGWMSGRAGGVQEGSGIDIAGERGRGQRRASFPMMQARQTKATSPGSARAVRAAVCLPVPEPEPVLCLLLRWCLGIGGRAPSSSRRSLAGAKTGGRLTARRADSAAACPRRPTPALQTQASRPPSHMTRPPDQCGAAHARGQH